MVSEKDLNRKHKTNRTEKNFTSSDVQSFNKRQKEKEHLTPSSGDARDICNACSRHYYEMRQQGNHIN